MVATPGSFSEDLLEEESTDGSLPQRCRAKAKASAKDILLGSLAVDSGLLSENSDDEELENIHQEESQAQSMPVEKEKTDALSEDNSEQESFLLLLNDFIEQAALSEKVETNLLQKDAGDIVIILNDEDNYKDNPNELTEASTIDKGMNVEVPSSDEWTNGEIALAVVAGTFLAGGLIALFIFCPPALAVAVVIGAKIAAATGLTAAATGLIATAHAATIPAIVGTVAVAIEKGGMVMDGMKEVSSLLSNAAKGIKDALSSIANTNKEAEIEKQDPSSVTPTSAS